jgi:hypothetical protein
MIRRAWSRLTAYWNRLGHRIEERLERALRKERDALTKELAGAEERGTVPPEIVAEIKDDLARVDRVLEGGARR